MHGPRRSGPPPAIQPEGSSRPWRPSLGYLVLALLVLAIAPVYWWMSSPAPAPPAESAAAPPFPAASQRAVGVAKKMPEPTKVAVPTTAEPVRNAMVAPVPVPAPTQNVSRTRDPNGDLTPDLADYVNPGETPTMAEVITRLHQAGVYGGLGAFSPPGTRPPLVGLAVPEGFELPAGYVRHHQATDDGQRIEAILMFSPDYQWFDAAGQPIQLPPDRVVPPELAPPGLPIRRIVVPAPVQPGK